MSKYQALKDELAKGETCWPWSDTVRALLADLERAEKALKALVTAHGSILELRESEEVKMARAALAKMAGGE